MIKKLRNKLILREGWVNEVYKDSERNLTVGVGHLVRKSDNLKYGDYITDARVELFLKKDMDTALSAAVKQADEIGDVSDDFIIALACVNFQLGAGWTKVFFGSWPKLVTGDYEGAIDGFNRSKWAKQTPVRVQDFIDAIRDEFLTPPPIIQTPILTKPTPQPFWKRVFSFIKEIFNA